MCPRYEGKPRFCIWDRCGVLVVFVAVMMVVAGG
jgi:hypothetical protein